jgi:hypothetical protein
MPFVNLDKLRPNNWFLDKSKLESIRKVWDRGEQFRLPAIQVTLIDNEYSLVDGHCRAFVALEHGLWVIPVDIVEPDNFGHNLKLITIFHRQGPFIGIRNIKDLGKRIIDSTNTEKMPAHISLRLENRVKSPVG